MSIAGVSSSSSFLPSIAQGVQNKFQQIQSQFQQLGKDLQSGNIAQAQQDFAALTQELPSAQQQQSNNGTLAQAFSTLGQDLQSGNLSAAQKDFATIQQDVHQISGAVHHHHRHHAGGTQGSDSATGQQNNPVAQAFTSLGEALQAGSLYSAQQAYATLQQDLQQYLPATTSSGSTSNAASQPASSTVNVTA